jgi:hypothetical protein
METSLRLIQHQLITTHRQNTDCATSGTDHRSRLPLISADLSWQVFRMEHRD